MAAAVNAIAGGGTFIAFPTLTGVLGMTEKLANATCTVGLWPGYAASVAAARGELASIPRDALNKLVVVSFAGGAAGGAMLLLTSTEVFRAVVPILLGVGTILGPVVAFIQAWPSMHALHRDDVLNQGLIGVWWGRIVDGSAGTDTSFYLFLICWLMWVTGGWLSWCVLRWRKPMLGLIPGAAAFATNLLNIRPGENDQNGYTLAILVLTLALLLWTNYTGSIASATRAHVKLTGDARWDFWESGLVAMAALIVLGIMLPPLSTVDRTLDLESSLFSNWAQLQQRLAEAIFAISGATTRQGPHHEAQKSTSTGSGDCPMSSLNSVELVTA